MARKKAYKVKLNKEGKPCPPFKLVTYKNSFDKVAYKIMAKGGTLAECCSKFGITRQKLNKWRKEHKSFFEAVERGTEEGKKKFLNKIKDHAWKPSKKVNNYLIGLYAYNVYGIQSEKSVKKEEETGHKRKTVKLDISVNDGND